MRPVARVRLGPGARPSAGLGDAQAAALRGRFEQLLHGGGAGMPAVSQTLLSHDAPLPATQWTPAASAHTVLHTMDGPSTPAAVQDKAPQDGRPNKPVPIGDATGYSLTPQDATNLNNPVRAHASTGSEQGRLLDNVSKLYASPSIAHGEWSQAHASRLDNPPTPPSLAPTLAAAAPSPDATAAAPERATRTGTGRASHNLDAAAVLPPPQAAPAARTDVQTQLQQPAARAKRGDRDGLPELVRDLVQAVVHMSRGREGQWRLTMALKPQVLDGTWVALDAQPGRLQVRFDCAATQSSMRLNAVRDDLRSRLTEALSSARSVDVSVEVHQLMPSGAREGV
jgi:Type III secretion protein (HpaP)